MECWLDKYRLEAGLTKHEIAGNDAADQASLGFLRGGVFYAHSNLARTKLTPALDGPMQAPMVDGQLALSVVDVLGRRLVYTLEVEQ